MCAECSKQKPYLVFHLCQKPECDGSCPECGYRFGPAANAREGQIPYWAVKPTRSV